MLSLGKLAPGQQEYYLDTVAKGAEEYYTGPARLTLTPSLRSWPIGIPARAIP